LLLYSYACTNLTRREQTHVTAAAAAALVSRCVIWGARKCTRTRACVKSNFGPFHVQHALADDDGVYHTSVRSYYRESRSRLPAAHMSACRRSTPCARVCSFVRSSLPQTYLKNIREMHAYCTRAVREYVRVRARARIDIWRPSAALILLLLCVCIYIYTYVYDARMRTRRGGRAAGREIASFP